MKRAIYEDFLSGETIEQLAQDYRVWDEDWIIRCIRDQAKLNRELAYDFDKLVTKYYFTDPVEQLFTLKNFSLYSEKY